MRRSAVMALARDATLAALAGVKSLDTYQVQMPETLGTQIAVLAIACLEGQRERIPVAG